MSEVTEIPYSSEKAVIILKKLYDNLTYNTSEWNHAPMMRMMVKMKEPFDENQAKELLKPLDSGKSVYIDYFQNHCIKVGFTPIELNTVSYDINHGIGHAKKILVSS